MKVEISESSRTGLAGGPGKRMERSLQPEQTAQTQGSNWKHTKPLHRERRPALLEGEGCEERSQEAAGKVGGRGQMMQGTGGAILDLRSLRRSMGRYGKLPAGQLNSGNLLSNAVSYL